MSDCVVARSPDDVEPEGVTRLDMGEERKGPRAAKRSRSGTTRLAFGSLTQSAISLNHKSAALH